ncbi:hypothetical protein NEOC84_000757|uniref:hypothetical protein n=1 Tax=Neochlamydia sp. AcF84 TaxID=2315858 RepID=UPI001407A23E|nr:hypothetical protein [Neochlamydia sp. AcF84]NGY94857.1 hypothetical protein [Neochlamydia sp. AcF84]
MLETYPTADYAYTVYLCIAILFTLIFAAITGVIGYKVINQSPSRSPYGKMPLRHASDLSYESKEKVLRFLFEMHQYDNRMFNLEKAALCRETRRIFSNAISWYGAIKVDWSFLNKRYPGHYVSWGSLSIYQQEVIRSAHSSLEGFQTEYSSPEPAPSKAEKFYTQAVPGPLYVDMEKKILLGWKIVPLTNLEVLVVQKPKSTF